MPISAIFLLEWILCWSFRGSVSVGV